MRRSADRAPRPTVLFLDDENWDCFAQLAALARQAGCRVVQVVTRSSTTTRIVSPIIFDELIRLDQPAGPARLVELASRDDVRDVQISEHSFARVDPSSPAARVLFSVGPLDHRARAELLDKLVVSVRLRDAGAATPETIPVAEAGPDLAVAKLGWPIVLKSRIGSGGAGVRVAEDLAGLERALGDLGASHEPDELYYERYVVGQVFTYGAVVGIDGVEQEVTLRATPNASAPLGPSAEILTIEDERVAAMGRLAVDALGCRGFVNIQMLRDAAGDLWIIDVNTRAWGSFAAVCEAGLDFSEGYFHALGLRADPPRARRATPGVSMHVFPRAVLAHVQIGDARGAARAFWREAAPYRRRLGVRYWCSSAVLIAAGLVEARRRRRAALS